MNKKDNIFEKIVYIFIPFFVYFVADLITELATAFFYIVRLNYSSFDLQSLASKTSYQIVVTPLVKLVVAIIFTLWFIKDSKTEKVQSVWNDKVKVKPSLCLMILISSLPFCIFFNLFVNIINLAANDDAYQRASASIYGGPIWLTIIATIILAPLAEELLIRGFIFKRLRVYYNFIVSAVIGALVFAVMHGNLTQGLYAFCIGFYFCYVYEKTKNILFSIILHMFFNMWGVLWTYTGIFNVLASSVKIMRISCAAAALIGAGLIYLITLKFKEN